MRKRRDDKGENIVYNKGVEKKRKTKRGKRKTKKAKRKEAKEKRKKQKEKGEIL